jgi:hypothetical protein
VKENSVIVSVGSDGAVVIGTGYTVGQVLAALDAARCAMLGVVLRPEQAPPEQAA